MLEKSCCTRTRRRRMAWNENRWEGSSTVTIRVCQTPVIVTYIQFYKTFLSL